MIKTFTRTDLIRFIYKETTKEEEKRIKRALLTDDVLGEEYKSLKKLVRNLDEVQLNPSDEVCEKILLYSKTLNLHSVKS